MSTQRRAELYLLGVTVIWGSTFVITKSFLNETSPLFYSAYRFLLAAVLLYAAFYRRLNTIPRSTSRKGIVLGLILYTGFALQTVGLQYTTASKSAFFTGMLVVLTPIVHYTVQPILKSTRKSLKLGNLLGVICAAVGLYLLTSPEGSEFNTGDAMTLVCALLFACYIVYLDYASGEPDKLQLTFVTFVICATLGMPAAFLLEDFRASFSPGFVASLVYLTVFATILAMWVQNRYQGDTTPTRAAVIFAFEPVIAGIFAYCIRGEIVGAAGVIGGVIIFGGLLLSEFSDEVPILNATIISR